MARNRFLAVCFREAGPSPPICRYWGFGKPGYQTGQGGVGQVIGDDEETLVFSPKRLPKTILKKKA